jgi:hypothetical protein
LRSIITRSLLAALLALSVSLIAAPASHALCSGYGVRTFSAPVGTIKLYRACYLAGSTTTYTHYATLSNGSLGNAIRLKAGNGVVGNWAVAGSAGNARTADLVTATRVCVETRRNTIGGLIYENYGKYCYS